MNQKLLLKQAVRACIIKTIAAVDRDELFYVADQYGFDIKEVIACFNDEMLRVKKLFGGIPGYPSILSHSETDQ